ncbi:MAG: peptidylprolyl isomerase [Pseudomonadota bacterium]
MGMKRAAHMALGGIASVLLSVNGWAGEARAQAIEGKRGPSVIIAEAPDDQWRTVDPAQLVVMELEHGRITIELSDFFAPNHVAQMKTLVKAGYYDGLSFYRVIEGFVAQGGDPFSIRPLPDAATNSLMSEFEIRLGNGLLGADPFRFYAPIDKDGYADGTGWHQGFAMGIANGDGHNDMGRFWLLHCTGAFAFGRNNDPDSASTEFYITLQPQRYLDRNLTVFGRVIDGMEHVQALTRQAPPEEEGDPLGDMIVRAWMGDTPPEDETSPNWQVFRTGNEIFADYVESRRNRPEAFFIYRPNHVDVCQLPIPVRQTPAPRDGDEDTP